MAEVFGEGKMEILLKNVGIIKNSSILLDGLTVITGKNSSGKTTVGKVLYAVIQANNDIESAFVESKKVYIKAQLRKIWVVISSRSSYHYQKQYNPLDGKNPSEKALYYLSTTVVEASLKQLQEIIYIVKQGLQDLTLDTFKDFVANGMSVQGREKEYYQTIADQFEERKKKAIDLCEQVISSIENDKAFEMFRHDRIRSYLNHAFYDQIKPIKAARTVAQIRMKNSGRTILNFKVRNKSNFEFFKESSYVFPYDRAVFVDNPFVIDRIESDNYNGFSFADFDDDVIGTVDWQSHEEQLIKLLTAKKSGNFFDNLEFQKRYRDIVEKINRIVPGEFSLSREGVFYLENGTKLNANNLATGSKLFSILKLLFMNGYLNKDTVLILDEPESHLHPEWINKFAEILVLLVKDANLHVLLTTHSPNLLLALNVFSKKFQEEKTAHFYLAKNLDNSWVSELICIDNDINEGYAHLSLPLIQMTIQQDALTEE